MRKWKTILALALSAAMSLSLLAGCGGDKPAGSNPGNTSNPGSAGNAGNSGESGRVYWLNFKPELDETAQALAKTYKEKTGVDVQVITAAAGTYQQTLTAEMDKSAPPTLFVIGNTAGVADWGEYAMDLTGTAIANELNTDAYNLYDDAGKLVSIGYCYECYGIIVNPDLVTKAGHSMDEIKDFAGLKAVAEDIHANAATLGFDAFTSCDMDDSSSWRFTGHMASPKDLATGGHDAGQEFKDGKAAFTVQGSWEYANYVASVPNATMIPYYCGVAGEDKAGLNCGTENCWAVNANVSEADQKATIDFMVWLVSDPDAAGKMVEQLGILPYKNAPESTNGFLNDAAEYTANGCYVMPWVTNYQPNVDEYRRGLVAALNQYNADQSDANWEQFRIAFVDGWAAQYAAVNG